MSTLADYKALFESLAHADEVAQARIQERIDRIFGSLSAEEQTAALEWHAETAQAIGFRLGYESKKK